jgi:outer membrane protein assembly factor BamB
VKTRGTGAWKYANAAWWALALLLLALFSCKAIGRDPALTGVAFGNHAVAARLNGTVRVEWAKIFENGKEILTKDIGAEVDSLCFDFDWRKGGTYRIEAKVSGMKAPLTIEAAASTAGPSPVPMASFDLEEVDPHQLWDYSYIGGVVLFSPRGDRLAVGSEKGYLRLFDVAERRILWTERIGEGRIVVMGFSPDGRFLAVGEQSRDAFLYVYDIEGKLRWKFRTADDIGSTEPGESKQSLPAVSSLIFGPPGEHARIYIAARRYVGPVDSLPRHTGRIYGLELDTGRLDWAWPTGGCMDASPDALRMDAAGRWLLFTNYWKGAEYTKSVYCLRAPDGTPAWDWDYESLLPGSHLGVWRGADISADGKFVAILTSDGRGLLLDQSRLLETGGKDGVVWERAISTPLEAGGFQLFAFPALVKIGRSYVAFTTGNTKAWQGRKQPVIEHPMANSLLLYDLEGALQYTAKIGGASYTDAIHTSADGGSMVFPVRYNRVRKDAVTHGVFLLDNLEPRPSLARLVWFHHTEGMALAADASPDGKYVATLEYPVDVDARDEFQDIRGVHRVHLLR